MLADPSLLPFPNICVSPLLPFPLPKTIRIFKTLFPCCFRACPRQWWPSATSDPVGATERCVGAGRTKPRTLPALGAVSPLCLVKLKQSTVQLCPSSTAADLQLEAIRQGAKTPNQGVLVNFDQEFELTNSFPSRIPSPQVILKRSGRAVNGLCLLPTVKSVFGMEPHTFYELLREMAPGPQCWDLNQFSFPRSGAIHVCNSLLNQFTVGFHP